jgi:hypothetical protein
MPRRWGGSAVEGVVSGHLAIAWSAVAVVYLIHPSWLPSPIAGFLVSTLAGLAGAAVFVVTVEPPSRKAVDGAPVAVAGPSEAGPQMPAAVAVSSKLHHPLAAAASGRPYPAAAADEQQCPRCGGFDVDSPVASTPQQLSCVECGCQWAAGSQPTVVVRSWLHHRPFPSSTER